MLNRRTFIKLSAGAALAARCGSLGAPAGEKVNDVHSGLNPTWVSDVVRPSGIDDLRDAIRRGARRGQPIAISGARHAMGGQQFVSDGLLLDMRSMNRLLSLDREAGTAVVEAGIDWVELIEQLQAAQGASPVLGIRQKQTGADRLTIGGALAANVHGRGLTMKPFIEDVEWFEIVDAAGEVRRCSRTTDSELFSLAIGGYGLFGIITKVGLKLAPRQKVQRVVEIETVEHLMDRFRQRIDDGFLYGDFQFSTDQSSDGYLREGVFSCYRPVPEDTPIAAGQHSLETADWETLTRLAHRDKGEAYRRYAAYYLGTSGQVYWSDLHQMSIYLDDYHTTLNELLPSAGSEMITEIYVPRDSLPMFMADVREHFRGREIDVIYGTIRLIEKDDESFLAWARQAWACIIFNLHVEHTSGGIDRAADAFRFLIDAGLDRGGTYYLTYHKWARADQVRRAYPRFEQFIGRKRELDPVERFQSDWYRHHVELLGL